MAYIEKEPIIEFITKGLNNPDKSKAFGYDAIEILTEIEYAPTADVALKSEVAREIFEEMQSCLIQRHWNGLDIISFEFDAVKYAELKKKYQEGEPNGSK